MVGNRRESHLRGIRNNREYGRKRRGRNSLRNKHPSINSNNLPLFKTGLNVHTCQYREMLKHLPYLCCNAFLNHISFLDQFALFFLNHFKQTLFF